MSTYWTVLLIVVGIVAVALVIIGGFAAGSDGDRSQDKMED